MPLCGCSGKLVVLFQFYRETGNDVRASIRMNLTRLRDAEWLPLIITNAGASGSKVKAGLWITPPKILTKLGQIISQSHDTTRQACQPAKTFRNVILF